MRYKFYLFALFFLISFSSLVYSQDNSNRWIFLFEAEGGESLYLDSETIEIEGDKYTIWTKSVYTPPVYDGDEKEYVESELQKLIIDCTERKYDILNIVKYFQNGKNDGRDFVWLKWYEIVPESKIEVVYKYVCNYLK